MPAVERLQGRLKRVRLLTSRDSSALIQSTAVSRVNCAGVDHAPSAGERCFRTLNELGPRTEASHRSSRVGPFPLVAKT